MLTRLVTKKGHVNVSLQEDCFAFPDPPMNLYGSTQPEPNINQEEMETDTEEQRNNKKRKQPPVQVNPSSEEDEREQQPGEGLVGNLLQQNSETLKKNRELEQKLKAPELKFQLLARANLIPSEDIDSRQSTACART